VLLKISGEILAGDQGFGVHAPTFRAMAQQVQAAKALGAEVAIVVGGGNYIRGQQLAEAGVDRVAADSMGMLATVINALALQEMLEELGLFTRVLSAIKMEQVAEPFIRRRAIRHLEKGRIVIFAGGTGNPYFTTDTAAALRAVETGCEVILKATKVDGIYTADPLRDPTARMFDRVTHQQVLEDDLRVMDMTAITLCLENNLPIVVFNIRDEANLPRILRGEPVGTYVEVAPRRESVRRESSALASPSAGSAG